MFLDLVNICCGCIMFEVFVLDEEMKVIGYFKLFLILYSFREGVC